MIGNLLAPLWPWLAGALALIVGGGAVWLRQGGKAAQRGAQAQDDAKRAERGRAAGQRAANADKTPEEIAREGDGRWE